MRPVTSVGFLGLVALLSCGCDREPACGEADFPVTSGRESVPVWETFEVDATDIGVAVDNPFDPAELDLRGEFAAPDGRLLIVPGFVYQRFVRELVGGSELLSPQGERAFKVRFTPDMAGTWRWRLKVVTRNRCRATPWQSFAALAPLTGRHGFVRVSDTDHRYLRYDDDTPYFAVGENLAWSDERGTFAYDDWLDKLARQGANYVRVWMPSWGFGLEVVVRNDQGALVDTTLGDYRSRLDRAWALDHVLDRAHELGIAVLLCIQAHGELSTTSNSEWEDSPFNAVNLGPLAAPGDFFTDRTAQELFKRRLRYIVARWGHSPAILAWELFNEVDLTDQQDPDVVAAWHAEMAGYLKSIDVYAHPVTTSISALVGRLLGMDEALYSLPEIDIAQLHLYGTDGMDIDFTTQLPKVAGDFLRYDKPVLAAELGVDYRGPAETLARDPDSLGLHDSLWMGLFAGTAGSGMTWWWDNVVDPMDLYDHFGALADFVSGIVFHREDLQVDAATVSAPGRDLAAWALRGRNVALAWIKDLDSLWYKGDEAAPVTDASLILEGLEQGEWRARWVDPYAVWEPLETDVTVTGAETSVAIPSFTRDVGLRLKRPR